MSKGIIGRIDDLIDKICDNNSKVINILMGKYDKIYDTAKKKKASELTEEEVEAIRDALVKAVDTMIAFNGKMYGDGL